MKQYLIVTLALIGMIFCGCKRNFTDIKGYQPPQWPKGEFSFASEFNNRLGNGINIGAGYEGGYSNNYDQSPATMKFTIDEIRKLGFKHIRLPVTWDRPDRILSSKPYTINPDFMIEVRRTVDYALDNGLYVILNIQYFDALNNDPVNQKEKFLAIWKQLATTFADYPQALVFEILNEPHNNISPAIWADLYQSAMDIIRKTPENSNNAKRIILVGTTNWGTVQELSSLTLPQSDMYTILTVHYYSPMRFTHQNSWLEGSADWAGITWDDTEDERNVITGDFAYAEKLKAAGWPIHVGEFGAYIGADNASRARYVNYLSKYFTQAGFSWSVFNFSGDFGIYDATSKIFNREMIGALTSTKMPAAHVPVHSKNIYVNAITAANSDGWNAFNNTPDAAVTRGTSDNTITLNITTPGNDQYALGLNKQNINVERGKKYAVTFTASSTANMQRIQGSFFEAPASGTKPAIASESFLFDLTPIPRTYSMVFTALSFSSTGRMTFYIGGNSSPSTITIKDLKITEFYDEITLPNSTPPAPPEILMTSWDPSVSLYVWDPANYAAQITLDAPKANSGFVDITKPGPWQGSILIVRQGFSLVAGRKYEIVFKASTTLATQSLKLTASAGSSLQLGDIKINNTLQEYRAPFTATGTITNGYFYIFMSGAPAPSVVTFKDVQLYDVTGR